MALGFGGGTEGKSGGKRAEQRGGDLIHPQGSRGGGGVRRGVGELGTSMGCGGDERLGRYSEEYDIFAKKNLALLFLPHKQVLFPFFLQPVHCFDLNGAVKHFIKI